ncbi:rhodanese-related sulfurtransferase [Alkalihalobacillus pseudalcaliphilus]|uniref:oxygen-dependent tRNA uridine(34) hydroxylase TrhO n=1 Tax=Alkalihalobacillus pseudalcaliphilus TaxID=79884 RepID=UPI000ACCFED6
MSNKPMRVLLYYFYTTIENAEDFTEKHLKFCKELGIKGRVLIADEGINGTVSGTVEQTEAYKAELENDPRFHGIVFKEDEEEEHAFKKMHVRYRPELVTLRLEDDVNPLELTGNYLSPKEFYEAMQNEDTVVIDARNDYEFDLGHFRDSVRPDIRSFRELPDWIRDHKEQFEGKKILTYCTGGVRCEKFSGWLKREGFDDVSQLHGGIVTYGKDPEVRGKLWDGQLYVFDERISVPVNQVDPVIVGKDHYDGTPCERYVNCGNPECNKQILTSEENEHFYMRGCSDECRVHPRNRYIVENKMSEEEVEERLTKIEEKRSGEVAYEQV